MTFDGGPPPSVSHELLDVLAKHEVKAMFCYIGNNMRAHPQIVKRALAEGHEIGGHTMTHSAAALIQREVLSREMEEFDSLVRSIDPSYEVRYFRPPLGVISPAVFRAVNGREYRYAYVTFYVNDASTELVGTSAVMDKIKALTEINKGGAIVLHEMRYKHGGDPHKIDKQGLPAAVDDYIQWAKKKGYRFVSYSE